MGQLYSSRSTPPRDLVILKLISKKADSIFAPGG